MELLVEHAQATLTIELRAIKDDSKELKLKELESKMGAAASALLTVLSFNEDRIAHAESMIEMRERGETLIN